VYASVHAKGAANGFYRSDDAGSSWKLVNGSNGTAWYYSQVRCDPTDAEHVYRLNASSQESYDGGKSWTNFAGGGGVHGDAHALWINPEDREHIVLGNDGGVDISYDRGRSWYNVENIVGAQFYAIAVDNAKPFYNAVLYDNSSISPQLANISCVAGLLNFYSIYLNIDIAAHCDAGIENHCFSRPDSGSGNTCIWSAEDKRSGNRDRSIVNTCLYLNHIQRIRGCIHSGLNTGIGAGHMECCLCRRLEQVEQ
jgi:hypothetical protein